MGVVQMGRGSDGQIIFDIVQNAFDLPRTEIGGGNFDRAAVAEERVWIVEPSLGGSGIAGSDKTSW